MIHGLQNLKVKVKITFELCRALSPADPDRNIPTLFQRQARRRLMVLMVLFVLVVLNCCVGIPDSRANDKLVFVLFSVGISYRILEDAKSSAYICVPICSAFLILDPVWSAR